MKHNPFSLDFGAEPQSYILRSSEQNRIYDTYSEDSPSSHIFMITGARGTGKTVLMTTVSHQLRNTENWLHIDLNSEGDLLNSLASQLYKQGKASFSRVKFEASFKGIGISLEKEEKYYDVQTDLDSMLEQLKKHGTRLIVTVDEITNSKNMREFTGYFQHCLREELPIFLVMTGLYKNIRALQNHRSQTFLKRSPSIDLTPLNLRRVAQKYSEIFAIDSKTADSMAALTAGYSYGFQLLGYLVYEAGTDRPDEAIINEYKNILFENSYDKIWEELSLGERRVARAIAGAAPNAAVAEVRKLIELDSNNFSTYQNALQKNGLLSHKTAYGHVDFSLPFFREFVLSAVI